ARNGDGLHDQPGSRFPQPITDLIVEGSGFLRRVDMDVVAQPVKELGAVGLRIDRLHPDMFPVDAPLRAFRLGADVHSLIGLPYAPPATPYAQIGQPVL